MEIIPAIDIRAGKCVRLIQGRYDSQIIYEDDPLRQAHVFAQAGARWLHIVDLDGALAGQPVNTSAIEAIVGGVDMKVETGGGIRSEESIEQMLAMGVERVIIGTSAVERFEWFSQVVRRFEGRIVLGLDAKGSNVRTDGWTKQAGKGLIEFAKAAAVLPLAAIIYTDISRDGMMEGPNFERTVQLAQAVPVPVIASGGVGSVGDILKLSKTGVAAVIVGRALYEGKIDLREAIESLGGSR